MCVTCRKVSMTPFQIYTSGSDGHKFSKLGPHDLRLDDGMNSTLQIPTIFRSSPLTANLRNLCFDYVTADDFAFRAQFTFQ